MSNSGVTFLLQGFRTENCRRIYTFDRVGPDRTHASCSVETDMALIRKFDIRVQELPLLCRRMLEQVETIAANDRLEFGEAAMIEHSLRLMEAKHEHEDKRKTRRRGPVNNANGLAWRSTFPLPMK